MGQLIRTITLGLNINVEAPERSATRIKRFLNRCPAMLREHGLETRCLRVTCQPPDEIYHLADAPRRAQALAEVMEDILEDQAWFCLPGPHYRSAAMPVEALEAVPAVLAATRNTFTHTLVSSPAGVHRGAIRKAGEIIARLARLDERSQANFRFAVMANVRPNTPYFPAAYHAGANGFSIALELAALMNQSFQQEGLVNGKLLRFQQEATRYVEAVVNFAEDLEITEDLEFKGIDFSLAPFPGEETSAVRAVERLNDTRIGNYEFMFSLYAINNLLKQGFAQYRQVGYNGTMLSILEDSWLAQRLREDAFELKDLLLYACVCGCGLDMVPLQAETSPAQLASLIEPISAQAIKWNKPLTARLLPTAVDADGMTRLHHDFLVNTTPVRLRSTDFANQTDAHSFFAPMAARFDRVADEFSYTPRVRHAGRGVG
jgi:uncharacterized protein (UPF0210 family)